jgi:hypothetical protein
MYCLFAVFTSKEESGLSKYLLDALKYYPSVKGSVLDSYELILQHLPDDITSLYVSSHHLRKMSLFFTSVACLGQTIESDVLPEHMHAVL